MGAPVLIIDGVELPQRSRLDYQQTYQRVAGGASMRRMASGAAFSMEHWERWQTTISGGGWIPPALLGIKRGVPFEVHCVIPITLLPGELLPDGWAARTDWPEKTITDELGVSLRLVYPIMTVITTAGARLIVGGKSAQWELVMEQT